MLICLNYRHFEKELRSVIVSQNHYLNQILVVHPLCHIVCMIASRGGGSVRHVGADVTSDESQLELDYKRDYCLLEIIMASSQGR